MTYLGEIGRKLIHLSSATIPIVYWFTSREFALRAMIFLSVAALVVEALRYSRPGFRAFIDRWLGRVIREAEARTMTGATYVLLGGLLAVALFPKPIAITVLLFLSISDALASLIGIRFGRIRLWGKTLIGSLTFLISAVAIALFVLSEAPFVGFVGALVATLAEAIPLKLAGQKIDDNLTIPLIAGAVMTWIQQA